MNKKILGIILIVVIVIIAFVLFFNKPRQQDMAAELKGGVSYLERIALPSGSLVDVQIRDTSMADTEATIIAQTSIVTQGENVPIPFTIEYDSSAIDPRLNYSVFATITVDGELRWITDANVPFLENGEPVKQVELILSMAQDAGPEENSNLPTQNDSKLTTADLNGRKFNLFSYNGIASPGEYTLEFNNGSVNAKFCNGMSGQFAFDNGQLKATQMASTLMLCAIPEDLMDLEGAFQEMMSDGANISLLDGQLILSANGQVMIFLEDEQFNDN